MLKALCQGRVEILTFKQGFLSAIAHDLRLHCARHEVKIEGRNVSARFFPDSLLVEGAMRGSAVDPQALSAEQKAEILSNIREKILRTRQHPEVTFVGEAEDEAVGFRVAGDLELVGRRAPLSFLVRRMGGKLVGEVELKPSRWGIEPFRALLGAIRLQDRVVVRFDLEAPADLV
jgi:hypothetical protein